MSHAPYSLTGLILGFVLLTGCAAAGPAAQPAAAPEMPRPPTATQAPPNPTPHPFAGLTEWDVVVIGDSTLWGVAEPYARLVEADRKVTVNLHDEWKGALSAGAILKALRGDSGHSLQREKWPQLIRDAEVLVLFGNPADSLSPKVTDLLWHCVGLTDPGETLPADAFAGYRADLRALYEKIAELREGRPLILRATGIYNPVLSRWREKGIADSGSTRRTSRPCVMITHLQHCPSAMAAKEYDSEHDNQYRIHRVGYRRVRTCAGRSEVAEPRSSGS